MVLLYNNMLIIWSYYINNINISKQQFNSLYVKYISIYLF